MYVAPQSREERAVVLRSAIREIKLATLVTATPEGYHASHVPTVLKEEPDGPVLELHVARANPHWRAAADRPVSLAVFQGPHAYVSPSWYETKRQHGKVVPTWNYIAVHAQGRLEVVADDAWLHAHLDELTRANEAHRAEPWAVSDAPAGRVHPEPVPRHRRPPVPDRPAGGRLEDGTASLGGRPARRHRRPRPRGWRGSGRCRGRDAATGAGSRRAREPLRANHLRHAEER